MSDDPLLQVATDLRTILELHGDLPGQAANKASHRLMPGGTAMVMLGPVASVEANRYVTASIRAGRLADPEEIGDNADGWEPVLQTLRYWSEDWRRIRGAEETAWTIQTEAEWLLEALRWAFEQEPHWTDFCNDIARARRRLEDELHDGEREQHGLVDCPKCRRPLVRDADDRRDCQCSPRPPHGPHALCDCRRIVTGRLETQPGINGAPDVHLVLVGVDVADEDTHERADICCLACHWERVHATHHQGGLADTWQCPLCERSYSAEDYLTLVARDARDNATALPAGGLVERFGVTVGQVRMWASRGKIRRRGRDELGRMTYDVADVQRLAAPQMVAG